MHRFFIYDLRSRIYDLSLHHELPSYALHGGIRLRPVSSYFIEINPCAPGGDRDGIINAGKHFFINYSTQKIGDDELRSRSGRYRMDV